jgi:hypothetical protein
MRAEEALSTEFFLHPSASAFDIFSTYPFLIISAPE